MDKINLIKSRALERKLNKEKKQDIKNTELAEIEQLSYFETAFQERQNFIEELIGKSNTLPEYDLSNHFNTIRMEIFILQKYMSASSIFLTSYNLQKYQNIIQELNSKVYSLENELMPKKKFTFKNKKKERITSTPSIIKVNNDVVDSSNNIDLNPTHSKKLISMECGIFNKNNETIYLENDQVYKKDVSIENLTNCKVYIKGVLGTLHLNRLNNCEIYSGPVSTSIFAEDCENCIFSIACQQLRLHSSKHITLYLHVTSTGIMEDCTKITVGPYNWNYENINKDFNDAGLDRSINNWNHLTDFNWLTNETHSPNWEEINII